MRNHRLLFFIVVVAFCLFSSCMVNAQVDLDQLTMGAFTAISEAEDAGGEIDDLLVQLNMAILLIESGTDVNLTEARVLLNDVLVDAEAVRVAGVAEGNANAVVAVIKVVLLVGLAVGVWLRGDEYFWRLWRRTKQGYLVE